MNTSTIMHEGVEHTWCPEHKSRDESIAGSYMKMPHDHDAWLAKRLARNGTRNGGRRRSQYERETPTSAEPDQVESENPPNKKAKTLKLALNKRLATAMVTQHNVTPAEADAMFNTAYAEADASLN